MMNRNTFKHLYFHFMQIQQDIRTRWKPRGNDVGVLIEKKLKHDWLKAVGEMEKIIKKLNEIIDQSPTDEEMEDYETAIGKTE